MKTKNLMWIMALSFLMAAPVANGQITKIQNAKDKITDKTSGNKDKGKTEETEKPKTENMDENNKSAAAIAPGKGYFYTSFKSNDYKNEVNIGDDLYVRMELGKTMIELAQEKGLEVSFTAYGYVTVYIDGNKQFTTKPYSFASNISKKWLYINIPLNISPDFMKKIESDQSMLETDQDIWVFQQLFQEKGIVNLYTEAAMKTMATGGNHTVKVEFGLSSSDSKSEPDFVACTGEVKITVDAAGANALAENGPKNLRPLGEAEKGKFVPTSKSFTIGSGELSVKLELPEAPKYYNMKWCMASSCDYDHGDLNFYVSMDDKPLAAWASTLWEADYESQKTFEFVILPKNDAGINVIEAPFNDSKLFKMYNPVVYEMFDQIYSGNLSVGTHKLKLKVYSQQCVPLNTAYEFQDSYFKQWPAIAEITIDIIVTEQGRTALINNSEAKKLSHAGGEWTAVDNTLKTSNTGNPNIQIIDVATTTKWKIVTNDLGVILYRTCKADVLYKSAEGYRIMKDMGVTEQYSGGGTYGEPSFSARIDNYFPLDAGHVPVPESKVK